MLDLALFGFLAGFFAIGLRRPFIWVLAYMYIDIVAPQKISWFLLASVPISLIGFLAAFGGWVVADNKEGTRFTFRQALMLILLVYCGYTTMVADFPEAAAAKWSWVWKSLVFAIFLPLTLRTRLRIEAAALVMVLSAGAIIIAGGIKTVFSGGGYGSLYFFVNDNTGLYEGSTLSMAAVAIIPLIIWLARFGTVFPPDWRVKLFAAALVFSCLLVPVGTQTRTGLLCIGVLAVISLRAVKRRFLYLALMGAAGLLALPFLPASYTQRMSTIENHESDESASTRIAVWKWTLDYAKDNPMGGGFDSFLGNEIAYKTRKVDTTGSSSQVRYDKIVEKGRAFHSAYFELLGEQGWPGLFLWLLLQGLGLIQLEFVRHRLLRSDDPLDRSNCALANALQQGHIIYLVGALFVGVAYQPFIFMLIALQIALVQQVKRRQRPELPARRTQAQRTMKPVGVGEAG
ncbi:MAG: putative O-glycosylation ligase, exosortase A system-associated [Novosphingobium sp.]|nr:putative O-glycosylation ligase, exosortase A system-associated [Novosphingobium sp.]